MNLTQDKLARITGIAQSTISGIENGTHIPNLYTALLLSDALCVSVNDLFCFSEEKGDPYDKR